VIRRVAHISDHQAPGDYSIANPGGFYGDVKKDQPMVLLSCFECGRLMSLYRNHTIESIEPLTVSPSIVCPHPPCTGHYFIRGGVRA
jgi:hypothetical protein